MFFFKYLTIITFLCFVFVEGRQSANANMVKRIMKERNFAEKYQRDILEDAILDVPNLVRKYGYPVEVHHVVTEDGYVLEMHRIPYGKNNSKKDNRRVVLLQHGLTCSSADYILQGPEKALAYILAEEGFDVWLGNARGNYYSRKHVSLNPDSRINLSFWKFSFEEIGLYDLPAMVDKALEVSGQSRLHYIGHSNGGTSFFVLNSLTPEYNEKFISFQCLASAASWKFHDSPDSKVAEFAGVLETIHYGLGNGELISDPEHYKYFGHDTCDENSRFKFMCTPLLLGIMEFYNEPIGPLIMGHTPAGASVRQLTHNAQHLYSKRFQRLDHGLFGLLNLYVYGSWNPPEYNLTKVVVPTYLYYGKADNLMQMKDVIHTAELLPNAVEVFEVAKGSFRHNDFLYHAEAKYLVYTKIVKAMKETSDK